MRAVLILLFICLLNAPANADCRSDVHNAFSSIESFGPFHFKQTVTIGGQNVTSSGTVIPQASWHVTYQEKQRNGIIEQLKVDGRTWNKDEFGWFQPRSAFGGLPKWSVPDIPFVPATVTDAKCLGLSKFQAREVLQFQRRLWFSTGAVETLYVDVLSKHPVRYEAIDTIGQTSVATHYTYDGSITISPPRVDAAKRRNKSLAALEIAKSRSDPACRTELLGALLHGRNAGPFRFERRDVRDSATWSGEFVPPNAIHVTMRHVHGNTDVIVIGNQIWLQDDQGKWNSKSHVIDLSQALRKLPSALWTPIELIGLVKCAGDTVKNGRTFRQFKYQVFQDLDGAFQPLENRIVLIDLAARVPVLTEAVDAADTRSGRWVREYDKTIAISPPQ